MSVGAIKVTPQQMRTIGQNMNTSSSEWDGAIKKISGLVVEMDAMWDGLGNDTFNAVWKRDEGSFTKLTILLKEYADAIRKAADTYDAGEQEVRGIVTRGV